LSDLCRIRDDDNVSDTGKIRAFHAVITRPNRSDCYKSTFAG
jgi:hypothetical protein